MAGNHCDLPGRGRLVFSAPATQMISGGALKRIRVTGSCKNEFAQCHSMAGDVGDGGRGLDGGVAKEVQTELGILAVPLEQFALDYLGSARSRVRSYRFADLSCFLEYQGNPEE